METETLRQELIRLLCGPGGESFQHLEVLSALRGRALADELEHVRRSVAGGGRRFEVDPAACTRCGMTFDKRLRTRLDPPSRCPGCKAHAVLGPGFRIV